MYNKPRAQGDYLGLLRANYPLPPVDYLGIAHSTPPQHSYRNIVAQNRRNNTAAMEIISFHLQSEAK